MLYTADMKSLLIKTEWKPSKKEKLEPVIARKQWKTHDELKDYIYTHIGLFQHERLNVCPFRLYIARHSQNRFLYIHVFIFMRFVCPYVALCVSRSAVYLSTRYKDFRRVI